MADTRIRLLIFVASPSDTTEERTRLRAVVDELNRGVADNLGIVLDLVGWETHSWPGVGHDPQDVINQQIEQPDIVVGIFWKRLGTPTPRALSGTVEEIENALSLRSEGKPIEVLVYFNEAAYTIHGVQEADQITGVLRFRQKLEELGLLVGTYNGVHDFEAKVRSHLTQVVQRWPIRDQLIAHDGEEQSRSLRVPDMSRSWRDGIAAGRLSVEINPRFSAEVYAFISAVGDALDDKGLDTRTRDRIRTILVELLTNVADHAEGAAAVEIDIRGETFKTVRMSVTSKGGEFNVKRIVDAHIDRLDKGEREHGLLRVRRLSGSLNSHFDSARHVTSVFCEVYQTPVPDSVVYNSPTVAPIRFEYSYPKLLWIGRDLYGRGSFSLLEDASPAFREYYLAPLAALNASWLGIEFVGGVIATEDEGAFVRMLQPLESYFESMFMRRRVLVVAHDTEWGVKAEAASWAADRGLNFFDNEAALSKWLMDSSQNLLPDAEN